MGWRGLHYDYKYPNKKNSKDKMIKSNEMNKDD